MPSNENDFASSQQIVSPLGYRTGWICTGTYAEIDGRWCSNRPLQHWCSKPGKKVDCGWVQDPALSLQLEVGSTPKKLVSSLPSPGGRIASVGVGGGHTVAVGLATVRAPKLPTPVVVRPQPATTRVAMTTAADTSAASLLSRRCSLDVTSTCWDCETDSIFQLHLLAACASSCPSRLVSLLSLYTHGTGC